MAALTIDVGRSYGVRAELQNAVDAGALAGASGLVHNPREVRARAGQLMPQKSTDFYPKLCSGLVSNKFHFTS